MRTCTDTERRRQVPMARSVKSLRHDVRQHHCRLAVFKLNFAALHFITNVVVLDVDVFGAAVVDRILRHLDARLVVFMDHELGSY